MANDKRLIRYMYRHILILILFGLLSVFIHAEDSLPVIEVKADRTIIYPKRMVLTGEETLMDILQMVPELLVSSFDDVIGEYNLRIDNVPVNGDNRLVLSQMKAKDIAKIHVCANTGVAKGTIGMGRVLDVNMLMPDTVSGFVEGQGGFGKEMEGNATVNVLYGSHRTDLYANAAYRYEKEHREYLTLHMTNRFDDRNKLLTYITQQFLAMPGGNSHKVLGRARYFHTFNDAGTELLVQGGYQYTTTPILSSHLPMFVLELNTPLPVKGLTMMAGVEGDYLITKDGGTDKTWDVFNHDLYLQFAYSLPRWRFMAGHRVMLYNYRLRETGSTQKVFDVRNNTSVGITFLPHYQHHIQVGYYRKYTNPSYMLPVMVTDSLQEREINQFQVEYAYSKQRLTVQTEASYYIMESDENYGEIGASAYWKTKWITLTGGVNLYIAKSRVFAYLRLAPIAYLPYDWQIGLQLVYFTPNSLYRVLYGTPVYGNLSLSKLLKKRWYIAIEWHDMFDSFCSAATLNRHAANIKLQYRF